MASNNDDGFTFVVQGPRNLKFNKETRTKIKKQAMKAVGAARRQSGTYGKHNLRQFPVYRTGTRTADGRDIRLEPVLPPPMPLHGFERMLHDNGITPGSLAGYISTLSSGVLSSHGCKLTGMVACCDWTYFTFIPARYGSSQCLDDAVRCLMIKAWSILTPNYRVSRATLLGHYVKALRSLQDAVNDPNGWHEADVLSATESLAHFEVGCT